MDLRFSILIVCFICQVSTSKGDVCDVLCQSSTYTTEHCTELFIESPYSSRAFIFLCCLGQSTNTPKEPPHDYVTNEKQNNIVVNMIKEGIADNKTLIIKYAECIRDCHFTDLKVKWTLKDINECVERTGRCKRYTCPAGSN